MRRIKGLAASAAVATMLVAAPAVAQEDCYPLSECPDDGDNGGGGGGGDVEMGAPTLADTGSDSTVLVSVAAGALVVGGGILAGTRRRSRN